MEHAALQLRLGELLSPSQRGLERFTVAGSSLPSMIWAATLPGSFLSVAVCSS